MGLMSWLKLTTPTPVSTANPLPVTIITSLAGGDASAANQTTQITAEQAIQAGVGAVADAAATAGSTGSLSAKLRLLTTQLAGQLFNKPYSAASGDWNYAAASGGISNSTTAVTIKASGGGAVVNYITAVQISADALGAATELAIRNGAAGTVLWRMKLTTAGLGGVSIVFPTPLASSAATLLEVVTLTASITGGIFVNAQGYSA